MLERPSRRRRQPPPGAPPSPERIGNLLALELPEAWNVDHVDIKASQNVGTASAPVYKQRFEARITLKEDLYEAVQNPHASVKKAYESADHPYESIEDRYKSIEEAYEAAERRDSRQIVRAVGRPGDSHKLVGIAKSVYLNGQYNVFFEFENLPAGKGRPLAEFEGRALVEGSPEERKFTEERERRRQDEPVR